MIISMSRIVRVKSISSLFLFICKKVEDKVCKGCLWRSQMRLQPGGRDQNTCNHTHINLKSTINLILLEGNLNRDDFPPKEKEKSQI